MCHVEPLFSEHQKILFSPEKTPRIEGLKLRIGQGRMGGEKYLKFQPTSQENQSSAGLAEAKKCGISPHSSHLVELGYMSVCVCVHIWGVIFKHALCPEFKQWMGLASPVLLADFAGMGLEESFPPDFHCAGFYPPVNQEQKK